MGPNTPELVEHVSTFDGTWRFLVGWNGLLFAVQAQTGGDAFTLNDPVLGIIGSDLARLGPIGNGWVDLAPDMLRLSGHRGASADQGASGRYDAGEFELVLRNTDGKYDAGTSLSGTFDIGTTVRILARAADVLADLEADPDLDPNDYLYRWFTGRVDSWNDGGLLDDDPVAVITVVDDTAQLNGYKAPAVTPIGAGDTVRQRVDRILALASWTTTDDQVPGGLQTTVGWFGSADNPTLQADDMADSAWAMIQDVVDSASRAVFFSGEGRVTSAPMNPNSYTTWDQVAWSADGAAGAVPFVDGVLAHDRSLLVNIVDGQRTGGTLQTVTNAESVTRFGPIRAGRTDLPLQNDADAGAWAGFRVAALADPVPRIEELHVQPILWPEYDGADHEATVVPYTAGVAGTPFDRPLWDVVSDEVAWLHGFGRRHVVTLPRASGGVLVSTVAIRGVTITMDDVSCEVVFHTSSIDIWLDVFTLNDPVQGLLSRGHRLT